MRYTKESHHTYTKRGVFYFSRRVPSDLQRHYKRDRIVISLKTKSERAATTQAALLSAKLEQEWFSLRWNSDRDRLDRFRHASPVPIGQSSAPTLSEAKAIYLKAKGANRPKTFFQGVERALGTLVELHGDKPIDQYSRVEANLYRDALRAKGLQLVSVKKTISTVRAILNFTTKELGLPDIQAFSGIYLGEEEPSKAKRKPILNRAGFAGG